MNETSRSGAPVDADTSRPPLDIPADSPAFFWNVPNPAAPAARKRPDKPRLRRAPYWHSVAERLTKMMAYAAIASIFLILVFLLKETAPLLYDVAVRAEVSVTSLWLPRQWPGYDSAEYIWQPVSDVPKFNLVPLLFGTLKVTFVSMLVACPLAVAAAVYVSQYAPPWAKELIKPAIEVLAAIPSVVLGFFALVILATWMQDELGFASRLNAAVAGTALALAVLPIVFTVSEEALSVVSRAQVEASAALGAAHYQTVLRVVLPAASPGIAAAVALGFGRAIGETMVVLMASGNASLVSLDIGDSVRTLSATVAAELAEVVFGSAHYTVLFTIGSVLFVMTLAINLAGGFVIERLRHTYGGSS